MNGDKIFVNSKEINQTTNQGRWTCMVWPEKQKEGEEEERNE